MGIVLILLLLISSLVRFPLLNYAPPELFGDEVDVGYQAYSLLKTGQDLYGQTLPTYIHSLSEWRAPLLMYATVPTIWIFGTNEWGVRLPQAVFGSLAPIILVILTWDLSRDKRLSVLAGFALGLMPWHIQYSRAAFEVVIMLNLAMLGVIAYLRGKQHLAMIFFSLTFYTYNTALVFVPLLLALLIAKFRHLPKLTALILLLALSLPMAKNVFWGTASHRFGSVNLTNNAESFDRMMLLRQSSGAVGRFIYNRPLTWINDFSINYFRALSTEFLFVRGDPIYNHNLQVIGELFPLTAPFLAVGLFLLVKKRQWFVLTWLLLGIIPSALTADGGFHATRLIWMVVPLAIAIGMGLSWFIAVLPDKWRLGILGLTLGVFCLQFLMVSYYYLHYYRESSWKWWQVGYKDAMTQLAILVPKYDKILINNSYEPSLIRFLFWAHYPPAKFRSEFTLDQPVNNLLPGFDGFTLGINFTSLGPV
jgi:4-amino-4-deoxy-L-arabinose transferase-like glycosyltransferase